MGSFNDLTKYLILNLSKIMMNFMYLLCLGLGSDMDQYETAYACEESLLNITCSPGLNLNIIRANFGR